MAEALLDYFIFNGRIYSVNEFNEKYIDKHPSIYEVIRIIEGIPLFLEEHYDRLTNSAKLLGYDLNISFENIKNNIVKAILLNKVDNYNIKIVINNLGFESPDEYFYFIKSSYPDKEMYKKGVNTILYKAVRENPNAKVINQRLRDEVNRVLNETGCYEALLVNHEGFITEGSRSNVFFIKGSSILTAPEKDVLSGITRQRIINLCRKNGIEVVEAPIASDSIKDFQAAFISGTSPKVLPISKIDNFTLDTRNNLLLNIMHIYDFEIENYINAHK
ncbi:aminotransferase class IV [Fonticella tunisiensis]|uniref:Branched-chain amino acid aminotransferase n=1 Tax=Fonticella tunisiensis TaxID=1096341 RepID=A0A4R7KPA2_9CLOT|nr:aminotransferase class IV [Fonticella tunisiensis]TDT60950.1 branched-chain amino acid aminotransferase [Fonticella tunisiensis]